MSAGYGKTKTAHPTSTGATRRAAKRSPLRQSSERGLFVHCTINFAVMFKWPSPQMMLHLIS